MTLIHKKGDTKLLKNYRPITVKSFNFAVLKFRGFLMETFRGGFNFADFQF